MIRVLAAAAACLALAACQTTGGSSSDSAALARAGAAKTPPPAELARLEEPGCYTVDLFDKPRFTEPGPEVPESHARYVGKWDGGKWNGDWCHDLFVLSVSADGEVVLLDMHAPWYEGEAPATVFRRTGRITPDGRLEFRYGSVVREYAFIGDKLMASRTGGRHGDMRAVLSRQPL